MPQKKSGGGSRLRGMGVVVGIAVAAIAIFTLTHALRHIDYDEVLAIVERTHPGILALALMLVVLSYGSLTIYDLLALRTIGRPDIPYRIAALASFTSYPIAHGIGAVALVSPVIRYRIYACNGLGALDVANICFLTGLTFWLGNLTALGLSLFYEPGGHRPGRLPAAADQSRAGGGAAVWRRWLSGVELARAEAAGDKAVAGPACRPGRWCCSRSESGSSISAPRRSRCMC